MKSEMYFDDGLLRIWPVGELDHHGAGRLMAEIGERIDALLPSECVLDMSKLTFMDSSGIAVIVKTKRRMQEIGGKMWVENVPGQPRRVLDASGIGRIVKIAESVRE